MNVLIFSLDQALLNKSKQGDTLLRFKSYKKHCQSLTAIVPTTIQNANPQQLFGISLFPAFGKTKIISYLNLYLLAKRISKEIKVDLFVTNDPILGALALMIKRKNQPKIQINVFDLQFTNKEWLKQNPYNISLKWIAIWAIKKADSLRTDNSNEKEILVNKFNIKPAQITVVPITPSKKSQKLFLSEKKDESYKKSLVGKNKMILSVGNLYPKKGHEELIKAVKSLTKIIPNIKLVIAGEGPEKKKLYKMIKGERLDNEVILLGSTPYSKMPKLFAAADLFVLASKHEGFPRVLMEAAFAETPILTTNISGTRDLLKHNISAKIITSLNSGRLTNEMVAILKNPKIGKEMAKKAKANALLILNFEKNVNKLIKSWKNTIEQPL